MAAATPEIAIKAALAADSGVSAITTRIYPQEATQEPQLPCIVYQRQGGTGRARLGGGSALKQYTIRLDCYATTEAGAGALANAVDAALDGYRNLSDGVQSVFAADTDAEVIEGGAIEGRLVSRSFTVWHSPT